MKTTTDIYETLIETYSAEQVLDQFGIHPNSNNKILCIEHSETEPSAHVYLTNVYCFGCKKSWSIYTLAQALLEKRDGHLYKLSDVMRWFETSDFAPKSNRTYTQTGYEGSADVELVDYWFSCLTERHRRLLYKDRKLTDETINKYRLGWRPDWGAFVIPFWRGGPGESEIDIIQFRLTNSKQRYLSLKGHSRGSVMNAHLLEAEQPYLVVLLGAFDSILALQDGIIAVGLNG